ncbi:MAG: YmdB family metallophosphoesterase [Magnetococcales bacterium]|nr:YmdB family metallophosphoesterase [Magnetococcales bacterium]
MSRVSDPTCSILLLGDVMGRSGRRAIQKYLPDIRRERAPDLVVANGENAASGIGLTPNVVEELLRNGVDLITSGNHIWRYREIVPLLERNHRLLRPRNYPLSNPGRGFVVHETGSGLRIGVLNLLGRIFMDPVDCPFQSADECLRPLRLGRDVAALVVDFHAETTSEKMAMAHYLDGRVSAVLGTHTHVPTADHRVLPGGTAFQSDVGMTGCYQSIIGMSVATALPRFITRLPAKLEPEMAEGALCGTLVTISTRTGLCQTIEPVRRGPGISPAG